jgi:hypothetical protein
MYFKIKYTYNRKNERIGLIKSKGKEIKTPSFIFCATKMDSYKNVLSKLGLRK